MLLPKCHIVSQYKSHSSAMRYMSHRCHGIAHAMQRRSACLRYHHAAHDRPQHKFFSVFNIQLTAYKAVKAGTDIVDTLKRNGRYKRIGGFCKQALYSMSHGVYCSVHRHFDRQSQRVSRIQKSHLCKEERCVEIILGSLLRVNYHGIRRNLGAGPRGGGHRDKRHHIVAEFLGKHLVI